jgi:N-methylhydantoinase A
VTDANLVLGLLGTDQPLGGEVALDPDLAHRACERLGRKLGMGALEVAWGIRQIVNASMAGATRAVSVGRGYDPRDFSLIAFGGAGPMHAVDIATELEIPKILVPSVPGCLSALGLVVSDVTHDYVVSRLAPVTEKLEPELDRHFGELIAGAHSELQDEGIEEARRELLGALDLRYVGEQSSVSVPVEGTSAGWLQRTLKSFHATHHRLYGFSVLDEPVELVNVRLRAVGRLYRGGRDRATGVPASAPTVEPIGSRQVAFGPAKSDRIEVPVYTRTMLLPHARFHGPAIVEQSDSTLHIPSGKSVRVDAYANLVIEAATQ